MPIYEFTCRKCNIEYDELCSYDETGKYKKVKCPNCGSKKKDRMMSTFTATFADPRGTSKADSFSYVAGYNMEQAKEERRRAESLSHMGKNGGYNPIDDISSGKYEGEVK